MVVDEGVSTVSKTVGSGVFSCVVVMGQCEGMCEGGGV